MVVKIQVEVFWIVTLCSVAVGYQHFGGSCCLHLQGRYLKQEETALHILCNFKVLAQLKYHP